MKARPGGYEGRKDTKMTNDFIQVLEGIIKATKEKVHEARVRGSSEDYLFYAGKYIQACEILSIAEPETHLKIAKEIYCD